MDSQECLFSIKDIKNNSQTEIFKQNDKWDLFKVNAEESGNELKKDENSFWIEMSTGSGSLVGSDSIYKWKIIFTGINPEDDVGLYEGTEYIVLENKPGKYLSCDEDSPIVYFNNYICNSQKWKYKFVKVFRNDQYKIGLLLISPSGKYLTYNSCEQFLAERTCPGEFEVFYSS